MSLGFLHHFYSVVHEPFWLSRSVVRIHFHLHIRAGLLTGMPRRHQDVWSRSAPSWYQKDWQPLASGGDKASEGYTVWSRRDTRGTSSSGQADNTETWVDIPRKKIWRLHGPTSGSCKRNEQQERKFKPNRQKYYRIRRCTTFTRGRCRL